MASQLLDHHLLNKSLDALIWIDEFYCILTYSGLICRVPMLCHSLPQVKMTKKKKVGVI